VNRGELILAENEEAVDALVLSLRWVKITCPSFFFVRENPTNSGTLISFDGTLKDIPLQVLAGCYFRDVSYGSVLTLSD